MEILREWFFWGESDLFLIGIAIIAVAALLPWRSSRRCWIFTGLCAAVYVLCELAVAFCRISWLVLFLLLFLGGAALSVAAGRLLRGIFEALKK